MNDDQPQDDLSQWFNATPSPQVQQTPQQAEPPLVPHGKSKHIRLILLAIVVSLVVISGVAAGIWYVTKPKACLNAAQYAEISGKQSYGTLHPTDYFYSLAISFSTKSSTYDSDAKGQIAKIATFYQKYHSSTSMVLTVSNDYYTGGATASLSQQRINQIVRDLQAQGVDKSAITLKQPAELPADEELADNGLSLDTPAQIDITSVAECR